MRHFELDEVVALAGFLPKNAIRLLGLAQHSNIAESLQIEPDKSIAIGQAS
jgi:hypothetical protein